MPNNLGIVQLSATTAGTTIAASDVASFPTQAIISFENASVRANLRGVKATGLSGGTRFDPGDIWLVKGNDYRDAIRLFTFTALTDSTTGNAILELFDGFDRA